MSATLPAPAVPRLPLKAETSAKADLRKTEVEAWKTAVGRAIARTQQLAGLSLVEFAGALQRDPRQVSRWQAGDERPQFDAIFAVESLRFPLIQALSELAKADVEVTVRLRSAR